MSTTSISRDYAEHIDHEIDRGVDPHTLLEIGYSVLESPVFDTMRASLDGAATPATALTSPKLSIVSDAHEADRVEASREFDRLASSGRGLNGHQLRVLSGLDRLDR